MKRSDDQKIRDAFSENEEIPIVQEIEKENLWLAIEKQLPKRRKRYLNWYRSAAAILILVVLSGWSITLLKYNQIKTVNKQLTTSVKEMENILDLQKKQIAEIQVNPEKKSSEKVEYKVQLPEKRTGEDHLLSENKKLKDEIEFQVLKIDQLKKQLNILSMENNRWADTLQLVTETTKEPKELPLNAIEPLHKPERQVDNKINTASSDDVKTEVYLSGIEDKRTRRRLRIQLFNPGEPIANNRANDVSIFNLFK